MELRVDVGSRQTEVKGNKENKASYGTVTISRDKASLLKVTATLDPAAQRVGLRADGDGVAVNWTIDFAGAETTQRGVISGQANKKEIKGEFDMRSGKPNVDLALSNWLPAATEEDVRPLLPALDELAGQLKTHAAEHEATKKGGWSSVGHAACWGFASMGAAASCVVTAGVGCPLAAGAFGAAAAYCADQYD
jgi:hypothetical protein